MKKIILGLFIFSSLFVVEADALKKRRKGGDASVTNSIVIKTKGEQLLFDKTSFTVKAGQEITVTFHNTAKAMKHNWVLVKNGKANEVGMAALKAGQATDWVVDNPNIIKQTKMLKPGAKQTLKFKAPSSPGDYPFICTYQGHYLTMKGVLKVVK